MPEPRAKGEGAPVAADPDAIQPSARAKANDATQLSGAPKPDPKPVAHLAEPKTLEEELLHEIKRTNHLLGQLSGGYRRFTFAFLSGMIRGLGAAIGATVVFAIFLAAVSRLDTTPFIGNWVRRVVSVVKSSPGNPTTMMGNAFLEADPVLDVESDPAGAQIFVDDRDTGRKTPAPDLTVDPGHHTVRLVLGNHSASFEVDAKSGETAKPATAVLR